MNTEDFPTDRRPLGMWLRLVDDLITREFASALEAEGVSRREWMLLNALSGDVDAPWLAAKLERRGKGLRRLERRGWIAQRDGAWQLTDDGRAARERLAEAVQGVRAKVSGAVSPEDWTTLTTSLEAIARELGWDESEGMPRGRRTGRGRRHGRGRHGHGHHSHHRHGHPHCGHGPRHGHGHPHAEDAA